MSAPREHKPTFGWLHRHPDPDRPLDAAYVQRQWSRLYRPGPWRTAGVAAVSLVACALAFVALVSMSAAVGLFTRLVVSALGIAVVGAVLWFGARVLAAGVYVTDHAVRLTGLRRHRILPWSEVVDVRRVPARPRAFGIGPRRDGTTVVMVDRAGDDVATPLTSVSADFLGRAEAFDMAALGLERWWHDSTSTP
jgi:hypothetical protein